MIFSERAWNIHVGQLNIIMTNLPPFYLGKFNGATVDLEWVGAIVLGITKTCSRLGFRGRITSARLGSNWDISQLN